jgi:membrane-bound lytic murein transglycosylase B
MKVKFLGYFLVFVLSVSVFPVFEVSAATEAELKEQLAQTEKEIAEQQAKLDAQKAKSNVILGEVNKLTTKINSVQKNIDAKNSVLKEIGSDINIKDQTVSQLNDKLDRSTDVLSALVRAKNKMDDVSLFEIVNSNKKLSDFFVGVDELSKIQITIDDLLDQIRELRGLTQEEKKKLEEKKYREQELKTKIELEKKQVVGQQTAQKDLLASSKAVEQKHAQELAAKQAKAAAIRSELFKLRDTGSITFEQALQYANTASKLTGVRTAFILGILKQETNIGQYLGSCVITDLESGATKSVNSGTIFDNGIHPTRDLPVLQSLLKNLGKDPLTTRVSCPQGYGYGGAMGPSQFIPSTWVLYQNRIAQSLGVSAADPWNPQHAIMGTALLLKDSGAAAGTYDAEFEAAGRYYAGGNWATAGRSYAASVLGHAATFQANVDFLDSVK